jgi:hypothetical protein
VTVSLVPLRSVKALLIHDSMVPRRRHESRLARRAGKGQEGLPVLFVSP